MSVEEAGRVSLEALGLASRIVLTAVLAAAAAHKLRDLRGFFGVLSAYRVLPERLVPPAGLVAIALEASVALAFWLPAVSRGAAAVGAGLLTLYALAIGVNLRRGRSHLDCGCSFGDRGQPISNALVLRNGLLVLACGASVLASRAAIGSWTVSAIAIAGGAGLLIAYRGFETLLANGPALSRLAPERG